MEQVSYYRTTEEDFTLDDRVQIISDPINSMTEHFQFPVTRESRDYSPCCCTFRFMSPIQIASPTEIDIDRDAMIIGKLYDFELGDVHLFAVKQADGTIEFFAFS
jgi:hypothetical protein